MATQTAAIVDSGAVDALASADTLTLYGIISTGQDAIVVGPYGAGAGQTGELRFKELAAGGSNYTGFKAPDALTANVIYTLPAADGSSGQFLQTNGSGLLTWAANTATGHAMLSATHTDSAASAVSRGSLIYGNASPAWAKLAVGAANDILGTDGTDVAWVAATGTGSAVRATSPTFVTQITTPLLITTGALGVRIDPTGGVGGTLRLMEGDAGGNYSEIKAAVTMAGNVTYTLPAAAPTVTGQALECTTGGVTSWASQYLLSAGHGDTTAGTVVRGDVITGQGATATWARLTLGAAYSVLGSDGTDVGWVTSSGTGSVVRSTAPTFGSYFDVPEISTPSNPSADHLRIYSKDGAGTTKLYHRDSAGAETCLSDLTSGNHAVLSATHTDSNPATVSRGSLIYGNATPQWAELSLGAAQSVLSSDGTDAYWASTTGSGDLVRATSPTIVTPTIASFVNANHTHADAAGGGTLAASVIASGQLALARGGTNTDLSGSAAQGDILYTPATTTIFTRLGRPSAAALLYHAGTASNPLWSTVTGTGTVVVMATSPTIATPTISGAIAFPDDVRQTFNPGANAAGLNVGSVSAVPGTPSNGDLWYDTSLRRFRCHQNGGTGDAVIADTADADTYIATTGNDTTGDGTVGNPWLTLAKAMLMWPKFVTTSHTIHVADGTYAEGLNFAGFVGASPARLKVTGNTTTPANVVFTGTFSAYGATAICSVAGPLEVELEGLTLNAAATRGVIVYSNARVLIDRCVITGTLVTCAEANETSRLTIQGNVTLSGFSGNGIYLRNHSYCDQNGAGTLTITGPATGEVAGINIAHCSNMRSTVSGANITITGVFYGILAGLQSNYQHITNTGTVTVDNASTPTDSIAFRTTDNSTIAISQAVVVDNFHYAFLSNSLGYIEATGSRTLTNVTVVHLESQNAVIWLP